MSHLKLVVSNKNIETKTTKNCTINHLKLVVSNEQYDDEYDKIAKSVDIIKALIEEFKPVSF